MAMKIHAPAITKLVPGQKGFTELPDAIAEDSSRGAYYRRNMCRIEIRGAEQHAAENNHGPARNELRDSLDANAWLCGG